MQPLAQTPNPPAAPPRRNALLLGILGLVLIIGGIYSIWLGFTNLPWGLFSVLIALAAFVVGLYLLMVFAPVALVARRDVAAATSTAPTNPDVVKLVKQLEQAGFYKYADAWMVDELRREAEHNGYLYHQLSKRIYEANSEQLAERGVRQFVSGLSDFLRGQGVKIASFDEDYGDGYTVTVNGKGYLICTAEELAQAQRGSKKLADRGGLAYLTVSRTLALLNELLAATKSDERAYLLQGDDEEWALFLTPKLYGLLSGSKAMAEDKKPLAVDKAEVSL